MINIDIPSQPHNLDLEFCRALHEKDPDKMLELLAAWLETHQLTTSRHFNIPPYLKDLLLEGQQTHRLH